MEMVKKQAAQNANRMSRANMYGKTDKLVTTDQSLLSVMDGVNSGLNTLSNVSGQAAGHLQNLEIETQKNIDTHALNLSNAHSKTALGSFIPDLNSDNAQQKIQSFIEKQKQYHGELVKDGLSDRAADQLQNNLISLEEQLLIRQQFGRMELAEKQSENQILDSIKNSVNAGDVNTAAQWYEQAEEKGMKLKFTKDQYISNAMLNKEAAAIKNQSLSIWDLWAEYEDLDNIDDSGNSNFIKSDEHGVKLNNTDRKSLKRLIKEEIADRKLQEITDMDKKEREGEFIPVEKYEELYKSGLIDGKTLDAKRKQITEAQITENFESAVDLREKLLTCKFSPGDTENKEKYIKLHNEITVLPMETSERNELKRILKKKYEGTLSEADNFSLASDAMITAAVREMKGYGKVKTEQSFMGFDWLWKDATNNEESAARMKMESDALRRECEGIKDINQVSEKIKAWKKRIKEPVYLQDFQRTVNTGGIQQTQAVKKESVLKNATPRQKYLFSLAVMKGISPEQAESILKQGKK